MGAPAGLIGPARTAQDFNQAKKRAADTAESPELAAAYNAWFGERLSRAGTMAGSAPRRNQVMDRGGKQGMASSMVSPYTRSVGPLPADLGIQKNSMAPNRMLRHDVNVEIPKMGSIFGVHPGQLVNQLAVSAARPEPGRLGLSRPLLTLAPPAAGRLATGSSPSTACALPAR